MLTNSFLYLFVCWLLLAIIDRLGPSPTIQKALALVALIGFVILLLLGFVVPHRITVS